MEQSRKVDKIIVGKPENKRPIEIPRLRREDNIKIDVKQTNGLILFKTRPREKLLFWCLFIYLVLV